jgi:hypothetical protein
MTITGLVMELSGKSAGLLAYTWSWTQSPAPKKEKKKRLTITATIPGRSLFKIYLVDDQALMAHTCNPGYLGG